MRLILCALAALVSFAATAQARECSLERQFEEAVAKTIGFGVVPKEAQADAEAAVRGVLPGLRRLWWRPATESILAFAVTPMLMPFTFFSERQLTNDYVLSLRQAINRSAKANRHGTRLANRIDGEFVLKPVLYRFTERESSYRPTNPLAHVGMDYFASDGCLYTVLLSENLEDEDVAALDRTFAPIAMIDARQHPRSFSPTGLPLGPFGRSNPIGVMFWQFVFALVIAPIAWRFVRVVNVERSRQVTLAQGLLVAITGGSLTSGSLDILELSASAVIPLTLLGMALLHKTRFAVPAAIAAFSIVLSGFLVLVGCAAVGLVGITPLFAVFSLSASLQTALVLYMGWQIFGNSHARVSAVA